MNVILLDFTSNSKTASGFRNHTLLNWHEFSFRESTPFGWTLANALVFKKVRQALGLDRCRFTCSGAAPMMKETQEFFLSLDIPIYDIYGMSECSG